MKEDTLQRALTKAEALCAERGVRLTRQRRRVLELICKVGRPIGAYELLALLGEGGRAAPPTVYRALDFLLEQRLVHKIETLHAFVGCTHPEHPHACQFLICSDCGQVEQLDSPVVAGNLRSLAKDSGFQPRRSVVEVLGTCAQCARCSDSP